MFLRDIKPHDKLAKVLRVREIASQEIKMFGDQREAQCPFMTAEQAADVTDQRRDLTMFQIAIETRSNAVSARNAAADGEAAYTERLGQAERVTHVATGKGMVACVRAQYESGGKEPITPISVVEALVNSRQPLMPQVQLANRARRFWHSAKAALRRGGDSPSRASVWASVDELSREARLCPD